MGQSLSLNYMHIVFSTKHRQPLIFPPFEDRLYQFVGGICKSLNSPVLKVGGYHDHIHILCNLSKNISLVKLIQDIKGRSSLWLKDENPITRNFYWQDGYAAFSVGRHELEKLILYIGNQKMHHGLADYQAEMRAIMSAYGMVWDERYFWD